MPFCRETPTSRNGSDGSFELTFTVEGTIDDVEAEGLAAARAPIMHRGLPRHPIPNMVNSERGIFRFSYMYKAGDEGDEQDKEPQGDIPTIGKFSTKPVGGSLHITQCLSQIGYSNGINTQPIETARIIGLHKDGVAGCDIDAAGEIITLEKLWLPAAITGDYIGRLRSLKGKTNLSPYKMRWGLKGSRYELEYETGELKFLGAEISTSITPKGITAWSIVYQWLQGNNRRNVDYATGSQPIRVIYIGPHDYVWTYYEKSEIAGDLKAVIEIPKAVFVSTVAEAANYVTELGF